MNNMTIKQWNGFDLRERDTDFLKRDIAYLISGLTNYHFEQEIDVDQLIYIIGSTVACGYTADGEAIERDYFAFDNFIKYLINVVVDENTNMYEIVEYKTDLHKLTKRVVKARKQG